MTERIIDWKYIPPADGWEDYEADVIAWVDVAAFDRAWGRTDQHIVPGGSNGQDSRYRKAGEWFAENSHSNMFVASLDEDGVLFTDGRHRFSWLRDRGVAAIPIQISPYEAAEFEQLFGTTLRVSLLPG
ncbi:hypothetical protein [Sphingomonas sp. OTU376]|uniref:hypothetical protein n=1 Tax=Sphingomonas sp. OTU376 TaxID=3043863 RepID=UPI00313CDCC4